MEITVKEIKILFDLLIQKLQDEHPDAIPLIEDYYVKILSSEQYQLESTVEPAIGSLYDDLRALKKVLSGESPFTYLDMDRISSILIYISEHITPTSKFSKVT